MQEEQSEKALSGEFMERNTVESAIKTETDTRTEFFFKKGVDKLGWLCQRHKPQHPHHVKVSPWGRQSKRYSSVKECLIRSLSTSVSQLGSRCFNSACNHAGS